MTVDYLRADPAEVETDPAEKLTGLGAMHFPELRPGKFCVPDQLMAPLN